MLPLLSLIAQGTTVTNPSGTSKTGADGEIKLGSFQPATNAYSAGSETQAGALANMEKFISNVIGFLTVVGAVMFVIFFVMGAFQWITSGGDKGSLEKARNRMVQGILGLVILVASYSILGLLGSLVGLDLLNPADQIQKVIPII